MQLLEILRLWRQKRSALGKATAEEIGRASELLSGYEDEVGPGNTAIALDMAIVEAELGVQGQDLPRIRARKGKSKK